MPDDYYSLGETVEELMSAGFFTTAHKDGPIGLPNNEGLSA